MLQSLRKKLAVVAVSLGLVAVPVLVPVTAFAAATELQGNLCGGTELKLTSDGCAQTSSGTSGITKLITFIVNIFSAIVGIVAVIMIIYGGFKYITSGGDSGNVSAAKNTIIFAVVGLIIVALAQFIVRFVLDKAVETTA
ncbi:MAG TPA: pilin [Nevskiaceae bacterium]|nr:pilin [Nevskiaceae bacterium]